MKHRLVLVLFLAVGFLSLGNDAVPLRDTLKIKRNDSAKLQGVRAASSNVSQRKRASHIYIAIRTDGSVGNGTRRNPFDGSTSTKLDALLRSISNGTTVHLGAGTFQSAGFADDSDNIGFTVKPGCKYVGSGTDRTIFKVVAASASSGHLACAFCQSYAGGVNDVSGAQVCDMTIDVNGAALVAANSADLKTYGVSLGGSNNTISAVHLIHVYGHFATEAEAFGLGTPVSFGNSSNSGNLIENCVVDNFATGNDYGQMICITGGRAQNNWVIGQTTLTSAYQAYGANAILDSCYSYNCRTFLYMDSGDAGPVLVKNCRAWGITGEFVNLAPSAGFSHHDVRVMNSTVEFGTTGIFFNASPGGAGARLFNIWVRNNTATQAFGRYTPINVSRVHNFHSSGNHWVKTGASKQKVYQSGNRRPSLVPRNSGAVN